MIIQGQFNLQHTFMFVTIFIVQATALMFAVRHYDNTNNDFTYNYFTYSDNIHNT